MITPSQDHVVAPRQRRAPSSALDGLTSRHHAMHIWRTSTRNACSTHHIPEHKKAPQTSRPSWDASHVIDCPPSASRATQNHVHVYAHRATASARQSSGFANAAPLKLDGDV